MRGFRFVDLFAGIGGLRRGFESFGGQCVFTSEWDKYAVKTYQANYFSDHDIFGDITKVDAKDIPKHDVLLAGFPCQPFSIAGISKKKSLGRSHGFKCETQGTLFFDVARIIEHHQPSAFLLENVKNLVSHDHGNTFRVIYQTLTDELGYTVHFKVIDAKSFVPQHRERVFIAGFKKKNAFSFDDLVIPSDGPRLGQILEKNPENIPEKYTLSDKLWNYLKNYAQKHKAKGNGFGFGLFGQNDVARTLSARYYKDGSEILIKQTGKNPRRLMPRECARLMGFDAFDECTFNIPVSDTQAYRQFGNSVVVPVVKAIANEMVRYI
ncbi:MAG TPA: DNA (cytosine-5-)-methyltransferase [Gammaproteobacteria bacterium]|nr:DNA (cytosine-5-)-methyltransferase [Gammaproteobacteria bacterium]